jgi:hypothetical protein
MAPPGRRVPRGLVLAFPQRDLVPEVAARHGGEGRQREDVSYGVVVAALPLLGVEVGEGPVEPAQFSTQFGAVPAVVLGLVDGRRGHGFRCLRAGRQEQRRRSEAA